MTLAPSNDGYVVAGTEAAELKRILKLPPDQREAALTKFNHEMKERAAAYAARDVAAILASK